MVTLFHREDARDECQRYTGADLHNPEFEDEARFLTEFIYQSGITIFSVS